MKGNPIAKIIECADLNQSLVYGVRVNCELLDSLDREVAATPIPFVALIAVT
jgi:hypothetical protein